MLADALDLADAFMAELAADRDTYPVHLARGSAATHGELREPPPSRGRAGGQAGG